MDTSSHKLYTSLLLLCVVSFVCLGALGVFFIDEIKERSLIFETPGTPDDPRPPGAAQVCRGGLFFLAGAELVLVLERLLK